MSSKESPTVSAELVEALRERYTPQPVPPCRVCGKPLHLSSAGGGSAPTYSCGATVGLDGKTDWEHYERSQHKHLHSGDDEVISALDALDAAGSLLVDIAQAGTSNLPSELWGRLFAIINPAQAGQQILAKDDNSPPVHDSVTSVEPTGAAVSEQKYPTFIDLIEQAEAEIGRLAQERDVSIEQLFPSGIRLRNAPLTLRALVHATNGGKAGQGNSVGWFDPNAAGCVRWKGGFVRGDFNEGDPIYCQSTVRGDTV